MNTFDPDTAQMLVIPTYTGRQFRPMAPDPSEIDIEDIAHGLAFQSRFNGQTRHFFSIAQHNLAVAKLVPKRVRLAALLDNASAAYLGNLADPLNFLFPEISEMEKIVMAAIALKFSVTGFNDRAIQRANIVVREREARDLKPESSGAKNSAQETESQSLPIAYMSPEEAKYQFLELFSELTGDCAGNQRNASPDLWLTELGLSAEHAKKCRQILLI